MRLFKTSTKLAVETCQKSLITQQNSDIINHDVLGCARKHMFERDNQYLTLQTHADFHAFDIKMKLQPQTPNIGIQ